MKCKLFICPECGQEVETYISQEKETYPVKGVDAIIIATVRYCCNCNESIYDKKLDTNNLIQAFNEYNKKEES